jgi:pimeloyl-ACP methyl ester carboxylesterase
MEVSRIDPGGIELAFLEAGPRDGRPLLLVHGFSAAKEDFADHIDALGDLGWRVIAPDLRGHGSSSKPDDRASYTLELLAGDVLALADALGWSTFTLVGHSMGGMVAQHVAIAAPERLDAIVLMDTSHGALSEDVPADLVELGKQVVRDGGMAAYVEVSKTVDGPLDTPAHARLVAERPDYGDYGDRKTLAASPHMWLGLIDELVDAGPEHDRLKRLADALVTERVPALVIVGEQDRPFLGHSQRMARAIPGARLVVIADAGHSPQFEAPEAWFAALTEFLAQVPSSPSGGVAAG